MEEQGFSFEEFSVEMQSFKMRKVSKYDRLWKIGEGGSIDQCPLILEGKVYFGSFNHNVYCLDATDGRLVWKFRSRGRIGISSPVAYEGIIYVGSYDFNMYALDAGSGELRWKFQTRGEIIATAAVSDGLVYFGSSDRNVYALDAFTGVLRWKFRTLGEIIFEPIIVDNKIIFGSYDRHLYCLDKKTGMLLWKLRTFDDVVSMGGVAIRDGCLYIGSFDNYLRKIEIESGREIWKKSMCQYGNSCGVLLHGDMLVLPTEDGIMFGLDLDGNVKWKFSTTKPLGTPVASGDRIYFTSEDMNTRCVDLDGRVLWKFKAQHMTWWKPTVWEGKVYFGSYDCHLYVLDASTGELVWKFRTEGNPSYCPPPYEQFEVIMDVKEEPKETVDRKAYGMEVPQEGGDMGSVYNSRVTYGVSSQYAAKGRYKDSSGEAF